MGNDQKDDRKPETPEDVAALYAWANMQNVKYRDFSANRREHRAQQQSQRPVVTRSEVAPAMRPPAPVAKPAPRIVPNLPGQLADPYRTPQHKSLVDSKRPTAFREMPTVKSGAARDGGMAWPNLDKDMAGSDVAESWTSGANSPDGDPPNVLRPTNRVYSAPHTSPVPVSPAPAVPVRSQAPPLTRPPVAVRPAQAAAVAAPLPSAPIPAPTVTAAAPVMEHYVSGPPHVAAPPPVYTQRIPPLPRPVAPPVTEAPPETAAPASWRFNDPLPEHVNYVADYAVDGADYAAPTPVQADDFPPAMDRPTWLYEEMPERRVQPQTRVSPQPQVPPAAPDTLIDPRERAESRWFALRGIFSGLQEQPAQQDLQTPVTAIFSLAGGVGKTSMVATLGRALSAAGERVLLADTTSYGLLPFYYGARELRPGAVRTFTPPPTTDDSPVSMVSFDAEVPAAEIDQDWLLTALAGAARSSNRVIVDLATASSAVAKRILRTGPTVIVPIVPDMSSVIGLSAVELFFRNHRDAGGNLVQPYFVLNQFDPSQPLHLDVREVLRQQLGDRLLPILLRRSHAVSEALAEGMTVMDYAPQSGIADDYAALANWLRNLQAPSQQAFRAMRWSEQ